jgi:cytosine/adenosine deaminase-related metal-dependent hydrolase
MPKSGEGRKCHRSVATGLWPVHRGVLITDTDDGARRRGYNVRIDGGHRPPLQQEMIVRARIVVTMDGPPIENGAVAVSAHRIVDVGRFDEIKTRNAGETLDLGEQALLPGLINTHCHLDYTSLRGKIPPQKSFTNWIRAINAEKAKLSPKDYVASINEGFAEAKRFGTTAIANLTAFPELNPKIEAPIRTWWFAELIDVRAPERAKELVDRAVESIGRARRPRAPWGLAPHALFTASKDLFHRCQHIAERDKILLTTHLAESREETQMFRDATGPLYEFLKNIGRSMDDCGNKTPVELFVGALGDRALPGWIVVHLNELTESDFELLERWNSKFHVVHCPRSHNYFGHSPFPFERLRALGFNICLGTDSLASNESLSLFAEMRAFQKEFPNVSAEGILRMTTVNPGRALRQEHALGRIRRGFEADLVAVPCSGSTDVFEQIIAFDGHVDSIFVSNAEGQIL